MTASHLPKLGLALASLALAATACADVGGSDKPTSGASLSQDGIICNSIRNTIKKDQAAAEAAQKAGNTKEAALRREAVASGVEGAKSVKDCDISDLVGAAATPTP